MCLLNEPGGWDGDFDFYQVTGLVGEVGGGVLVENGVGEGAGGAVGKVGGGFRLIDVFLGAVGDGSLGKGEVDGVSIFKLGGAEEVGVKVELTVFKIKPEFAEAAEDAFLHLAGEAGLLGTGLA